MSGFAVMAVLLGALAACGNVPGAPGPEPRKTVPEVISPLPTSPAPDQLTGFRTPEGGISSPPKPVCEGGPLGCRLYKSTGGRDVTGELAWLKSDPLEVSTYYINGTWNVGVKTPCNGLGVETKVDGDRWVTGDIGMTLKACMGPEGKYEDWTIKFFEDPVTWKLHGATLVLQNSHGTVELKDVGRVPHM